METRESQLTKLTEKYESVSKNETCELARSYPSVSQREISRGNHNPTEKCDQCCRLPKSKDTAPRLQVSVDFAVDQWFQILLIHLNSKNKDLSGVLEPLRSDFCM